MAAGFVNNFYIHIALYPVNIDKLAARYMININIKFSVDHFYKALFSTLEQIHCTLVNLHWAQLHRGLLYVLYIYTHTQEEMEIIHAIFSLATGLASGQEAQLSQKSQADLNEVFHFLVNQKNILSVTKRIKIIVLLQLNSRERWRASELKL